MRFNDIARKTSSIIHEFQGDFLLEGDSINQLEL